MTRSRVKPDSNRRCSGSLQRAYSSQRMKRQACARSQSLQSHSLLYPYPLLERTPLRGAPITRTSGSKEAEPIAVSIRSGNAWLCFGRMAADFAHKIHIGLAGTFKPGIREGIISAPEGPLSELLPTEDKRIALCSKKNSGDVL
jgi:hypothetical protein